jgi:hypothetical protein
MLLKIRFNWKMEEVTNYVKELSEKTWNHLREVIEERERTGLPVVSSEMFRLLYLLKRLYWRSMSSR